MIKNELYDTSYERPTYGSTMNTSYENAHHPTNMNTQICVVCGDKASGKHYGTISCNGCKGFFRRTIRRNYKYSCRFSGNCSIDKSTRAFCRACRFNRCINTGMIAEQVQNERDVIGKRNQQQPQRSDSMPSTSTGMAIAGHIVKLERRESSGSFYDQPDYSRSMSSSSITPPMTNIYDPWDTPNGLLELLLKAEDKIKGLKETIIQETTKIHYADDIHVLPSGDKTSLNHVFQSLHTALILVIEWAKTLKPFIELPTDDQSVLMKNFAPQHIVLCLAYRSKDIHNSLRLINDQFIYRTNESDDDIDYFYKKDCERIMDQLVTPMRYIGLDEMEFVAMKACVLFNPVVKGLSNESVMKILETRRKIFAALEFYIKNNKVPHDQNRVGDLTFFILTPLASLSKLISEDVLVTKISGIVKLDMLMEELMIQDVNTKDVKEKLNYNQDEEGVITRIL